MRRGALAAAALLLAAALAYAAAAPGVSGGGAARARAAAGAHAASLPAGRRMAFERGGWVCVAALDGTNVRRLVPGHDPEISPDGARVAYTQDTNAGPPPGWGRGIAIIDLATGAVRPLTCIPPRQAYGPTWSPDGHTLLVHHIAGDQWAIARVAIGDSGFRVVTPAGKGVGFSAPCWARDGASFFCHDLDSLYRFGAEGGRLAAWPIAALFPNGGVNSGSRLALSSDGRSLLMDVDMDRDVTVPEWDGPPPALWQVDVAGGGAEMVSPASAFAWDGCWLDDSTIVHRMLWPRTDGKRPKTTLWRWNVAAGRGERLAEDARSVSVSR